MTQSADNKPKYKRRFRNYLLDAGLQLRYTAAIVIVAAFLTAGLGYKMYEATRDTSKVVAMTAGICQFDAVTAAIVQDQFASSDKWVLWGIVGFGLLLVVAISLAGILITHKVAGPLYKIETTMERMRDGKLAPPVRDLRKGDELQDFHAVFKQLHDVMRARAEEEIRVLGDAISALEDAGKGAAAEELRQIRKRKEESLEG